MAQNLADAAAQLVEDWPPLTPDQRDRLAVLLRSARPALTNRDLSAQ